MSRARIGDLRLVRWLGVSALVGCTAAPPRPAPVPRPPPPTAIEAAPTLEDFDLEAIAAGHADELELSLAELDEARGVLWRKYVAALRADAQRVADHERGQATIDGATMRFSRSQVGEAEPRALYIALHGGGGAPPEVNDQQWQHMGSYYLDSVPAGLYVAPRGVSDTWDLHFRPESYALYDRIIRDAIAFDGIDSDRVYLLGYSAGGDGVYQIAARMPDRFAAASMSAGHPNGVPLHNLAALPLLLSVGERDEAYERHRVTVQTALKLDELAASRGGYLHECFVHLDRPHNFVDRDPDGRPQRIAADPAKWLEGDRAGTMANTNAVDWVSRHRRNPWPEYVVLDPSTTPPTDTPVARSYWLNAAREPEGGAPIRVSLDPAANGFVVHAADRELTLHVRHGVLDLSSPIIVVGNGKTLTVELRPLPSTMARTLLASGDPQLMFDAELVFDPARGS